MLMPPSARPGGSEATLCAIHIYCTCMHHATHSRATARATSTSRCSHTSRGVALWRAAPSPPHRGRTVPPAVPSTLAATTSSATTTPTRTAVANSYGRVHDVDVGASLRELRVQAVGDS